MNLKPFIATCAAVIVMASSQLTNANQFTSLDTLADELKPASVLITDKNDRVPSIVSNPLDLSLIKKEDRERELNNQPYRFALPVKSTKSFTKQGQWTSLGNTAIWRLKITGDQVKSFNVGLKNVFLPQGAKLFFYSDNYQILVGPFTHQDNKPHQELWSPVIESNTLTIEVNVPLSLKPLIQFEVFSVSQGYRGIRSNEMQKSGSCNNDVVCPEANAWNNEIRSVARYIITDDSGDSFFCTGTLINNVSQNLEPYFLTAGHCGVSPTTAPSIVTYWNYETSVCQGSPDGQLNQFQTGTSFLAGTNPDGVNASDFAMVRLDSTPAASFNVYWSGWDNSPAAPSSVIAIHHPQGDEKRISFDNDPLTVTNYASPAEDATGTHLMVGAWDDGTTEGGSSGSGIWDAEHRLVGTLSGGSASCETPSESDWYGRFSVHWEGDGNANGQLKAWLDANSTGATRVDGTNACDAPLVTISGVPTTANIGDSLNFNGNATGGTAPYTYSWDVNGDFLEDVSSATPSFSYDYFYRGNIRLNVTDATGCLGFATSTIVVSNNGGNELFLANGGIPSDWNAVTDASVSWGVENSGAFEGDFRLGSLDTNDGQSAAIEVTQTFEGEGNFIAFAHKVSSEQGFDKLNFLVDGLVKGSWSGETNWQTFYMPIEAGIHTLKWSYDKDASVSDGQDKAWIDGVTGISFPLNQAPNAVVAQSNLSVNENDNVSLSASASNDPDGDELSFLWVQLTGASVTLNASNSAIANFSAPSVNADTTLTFSVTVSDPSGSSSVANVTVVVKNVLAAVPPANSSNGGGGSIGFLILFLSSLVARQTNIKPGKKQPPKSI